MDTMSPLFEKIEQLSNIQRIAIAAGIVVLVIGSFLWFSYVPKWKTINKLKKDLVAEQRKLEVAKRNAKQLNAKRAQMKSKEEEFLRVKRALPENEEIPSLLASISQSGKDSGLDFELFQPKAEVEKDFYAEIPVSIVVSGNYHEVAMFFDRVGGLSRIVNIKNFQMAPPQKRSAAEDEELSTKCTAVTYKFIEKPANDKKKKPTNKK
jgi:type IV pilus assembly protein PilO